MKESELIERKLIEDFVEWLRDAGDCLYVFENTDDAITLFLQYKKDEDDK